MTWTTLRTLSRRLRRPLAAGELSPEAQQTRRDQALAHRLRTAFEKDLREADVRSLHFYVQSGTVTIHGAVRHPLDRDLLVDLARQVPGVEQVVASLHVNGEPAGS